jgi:hypothetical protein
LVNERIGDDVFIDNSTTALPKRSVTLFGQPPSSALHSSGHRALRSWKARLNRLRKNAGPGKKDVPQGLKPDVFSIIYGPTKVVP